MDDVDRLLAPLAAPRHHIPPELWAGMLAFARALLAGPLAGLPLPSASPERGVIVLCWGRPGSLDLASLRVGPTFAEYAGPGLEFDTSGKPEALAVFLSHRRLPAVRASIERLLAADLT